MDNREGRTDGGQARRCCRLTGAQARQPAWRIRARCTAGNLAKAPVTP